MPSTREQTGSQPTGRNTSQMAKRQWAMRSSTLLAVVALGAAACGGGSSGGPKSGPSGNSALSGSIKGIQNGFGAGKVPINPGGSKGGTLNVGSTSDVDY